MAISVVEEVEIFVEEAETVVEEGKIFVEEAETVVEEVEIAAETVEILAKEVKTEVNEVLIGVVAGMSGVERVVAKYSEVEGWEDVLAL